MHEHLLIGSDCFFLELCAASWVAHQLCQILLRAAILEELLSNRAESSEFSKIETGNCLHLIQAGLVMDFIRARFKNINQDVDALEVLRVIEVDEAGLPELLCMNG